MLRTDLQRGTEHNCIAEQAVRHLRCGARSVLFSGDLGRGDDFAMKPPSPLEGADCVLVESTYGNCSHTSEDL